MTTPLESLPKDLYDIIARYLDPEDLMSLSLVSKELNKAAKVTLTKQFAALLTDRNFQQAYEKKVALSFEILSMLRGLGKDTFTAEQVSAIANKVLSFERVGMDMKAFLAKYAAWGDKEQLIYFAPRLMDLVTQALPDGIDAALKNVDPPAALFSPLVNASRRLRDVATAP